MTEIMTSTDLSKLSKSDIQNWLEDNRPNFKSYLKDKESNQEFEELWQAVSGYIQMLNMEENGLLTITSAIVNNLKWEDQS